LFDDENIILKKCKSVVTDAIPVEDSKDPDKCNVYNILKLFLDDNENQELRNKYLA
jgi:tryptophanyl-tRNA synthetase